MFLDDILLHIENPKVSTKYIHIKINSNFTIIQDQYTKVNWISIHICDAQSENEIKKLISFTIVLKIKLFKIHSIKEV
jgi:hypothetical protein